MYKWLERIFGKPQTRAIAGIESWVPAPSVAGTIVTHETAMTLPAVYACVNVIASTVASMPFIVYKRRDDGGRAPDPTHPVYDLLQVEPNPTIDANSFWTNLVGQAVLHGNGYALIQRHDYTGDPEELHLLDTIQTTPKYDLYNVLYYEVQHQDGTTDRYLAEDIIHIRLISSNGNGILGDSPVMLAKTLIGAALAAMTSAAAVFGNGALPLGYFTTPNEMDGEGKKTLREYWNRIHGGPINAGKFAILEEGTLFNPLKISLEDLQYNMTQITHSKMIAQLFGVPAHKIGILEDATYSNIEEQDLDFYKSTLRIWCERIESEVNRKLFSRQDRQLWYAEHNMNVVVRGNLASQTDHLVKAFGVGGYTVNNICQELGVNPIGPAGDVRFVLNNFVRLDSGPTIAPQNLPEIAEESELPPGPPLAMLPGGDVDQATEAVRSLLDSEVARMMRREATSVGKLLKRQAKPSELEEWYTNHRGIVAETVGPAATAYRGLGHTIDVDGLIDWLGSQPESMEARKDVGQFFREVGV